MNNILLKTIYASDNRYLNKDERSAIEAFAESIPARLAIAAEVEKVERAALRKFIANVQGAYPNFDRHHDMAWEKGERDGALTVRVIVQAMILDEMTFLDEKLLYWFRTINASFGMTPAFLRDSYTFLRDAFLEQLSPESSQALQPYFDRVIEVLSDIPEPVTPRV